MQKIIKPLKTFEDFYIIIEQEVNKRKGKWNLTSLNFMDYDDVKQIIILHIWKKWSLYDQSRSLEAWLNIIIANQIKNLIRNLYSNFSRPCNKCEAAIDTNGCKIYGEQCATCPLYAYWEKRKRSAGYIKIPVSIENHTDETNNLKFNDSDIFKDIEKAHAAMKKILKHNEFEVYKGLFINNESEEVVAKKLGYISNEAKRAPGYKQVKNIRKSILIKFKKALINGDIDIF